MPYGELAIISRGIRYHSLEPKMTDWSKFFGPKAILPPPESPMQSLRSFGPADAVVDRESLQRDGNGWGSEAEKEGFHPRLLKRPRRLSLFEIANPRGEESFLVYLAKLQHPGGTAPPHLAKGGPASGPPR